MQTLIRRHSVSHKVLVEDFRLAVNASKHVLIFSKLEKVIVNGFYLLETKSSRYVPWTTMILRAEISRSEASSLILGQATPPPAYTLGP